MSALVTALRLLEGFNSRLLALGRHVAWVLVALMVATILLQVFMRYVVGSALPWPEEVARAFMIWMMALVAGSGYRWGAFVSIDLVGERLELDVEVVAIAVAVGAVDGLDGELAHALEHAADLVEPALGGLGE